MIPSYDRNDTESALKFIQDFTSNANAIQDKVLEEILTQNADKEYLRRFLNGVSDKQTFKKKVPLTAYEDVKPYMDRIANGESSNIICCQPITRLLRSSGTSGGEPKKLPSTEQDLEFRSIQQDLIMHATNKYIDKLEGGKGMILLFITPETETPSGLPYTFASTYHLKSQQFRNRPLNWFYSYTCPDNIIMCPDNNQSMYCQLLCGLVQRDETFLVGAMFASTFVRAIKVLEKNWVQLCSNIRTGHVSDWITDANCRTSMSSILIGPNPELADLIEGECGRNSWKGIIRNLWPRAKYIQTIVSGAMAQYVPILDRYSGGLPIISGSYVSSEGRFGINLEPLSRPCDVAYTLLPFMAYYEFLPVDEIESKTGDEDRVPAANRLVSLVDVKVDCCYELVVTTYNGLYRYRVGDILKMKKFHNNAPQFQFIQRQGVVLSVDLEETSEEDLFKAVTSSKQILEPLGIVLIDYTSYSDVSSIPGHYVLFYELAPEYGTDMPNLNPHVLEECCYAAEDSFYDSYKKYRNSDYKSIGPLEIRVVKQGTFDALTDFFVSRGASTNQYKTPRGIKSEEPLKLLNSRVVANFFGQKALPLDS